MSARLIAYGVVLCAAIVAIEGWQSHLTAQGDARGAARVQAAWDTQENARNDATARDNATKFRNAERTAYEDAKRAAARRARDAAAATAVRELRAQNTELNSRANPYPPGDAGIAACSREASTARELFGESAGAYQELAAEADGLRDQVIGLQDFTRSVCRASEKAADASREMSNGL